VIRLGRLLETLLQIKYVARDKEGDTSHAKYPQHSDALPAVIDSKCTSCGDCVRICSVNAVEEVEGRYIISGRCIRCMMCEVLCPEAAISPKKNEGE